MSLLSAEPPAPVRSLDELFAIAGAMEEEAASRYAGLAAQMRALDLPAVAAAFEHLAAEERGHAEAVTAWARARTGAPPDPAMIRWRPPETFDEDEARALASSRLASAYRALSMAVRNEERAFALWTYIAAQAGDPAIRSAAERMAGEELRHAALLRRERRRAFHAERQLEGGHPGGAPRQPPLAEAVLAEGRLAALLSEMAARPATPDDLVRLTSESLAMLGEARQLAGEGGTGECGTGLPARPMPGSAASLDEALRWSERSIEAYLAAADAAAAEQTMGRLQSLAARAIGRAAALRQMDGRG